MTRQPAWLIDPLNGGSPPGRTSQPAALVGYPLITVPAGFVAGELPVGITFMGTAFSERMLINIATAFERTTMARRPPRLLASIS